MPFLFEKVFFTTCTNKHCEDKKNSSNQKTKTQTIYSFYDQVVFLSFFYHNTETWNPCMQLKKIIFQSFHWGEVFITSRVDMFAADWCLLLSTQW